jgi:acetylornithine deacetylase/succinyl-diaminopimelate desuccinylase-like protein
MEYIIDWKKINEEAVRLLSEYLKYDTSNPPGNERKAVEFLADILKKEGYTPQILPFNESRASLVCRLKGKDNAQEQPLLIMSHVDVVGAVEADWQVAPFSGTIKDGYIWGRGAVDCKGLGIMELMAFILLKRAGVTPKRDIVLLAVADEEAGGEAGAEWVVKNHWDKVAAGYVLNEGGMGISGLFGKDVMMPCIGEKGPLWIKLKAKGESGHGSMPTFENPNDKLVFALERVARHETKIMLLPEVRNMLLAMGKELKFPVSLFVPLLTNNLFLNIFRSKLKKMKKINAILRNTISITNMKSGFKENVIPSESEAILDCRLLPGQDKNAFIEELRNVIHDPDITIEVLQFHAPSQSSSQNRLMEAIRTVIMRNHPDTPFCPILSSGFTDSRFFREKGAIAYGFIPCLFAQEEIDSMHGTDEKISLKCMSDGIKNIFDLCREF